MTPVNGGACHVRRWGAQGGKNALHQTPKESTPTRRLTTQLQTAHPLVQPPHQRAACARACPFPHLLCLRLLSTTTSSSPCAPRNCADSAARENEGRRRLAGFSLGDTGGEKREADLDTEASGKRKAGAREERGRGGPAAAPEGAGGGRSAGALPACREGAA